MNRYYLSSIGSICVYFCFSFLFLFLMPFSNKASATVICVTGCGPMTTYLSADLSSSNNEVGYSADSSPVIANARTLRYSQAGTAGSLGWYPDNIIPPIGTIHPDWTYVKIDDYISVALLAAAKCGDFYFPFNTFNRNAADCTPHIYAAGDEQPLLPTTYSSRIKVTKKIVNGTYSKNILLGYVGGCQPAGCTTPDFKRAIYISLNIVVPQSCEINTDQVIDIDFGAISAGAFKMAGVAAEGVQSKSKTVGIKCNNIAGNAQMTMRLQADKVSGSIVVSDENNDVGFRVMDSNGIPLLPNNLSSLIPFTLDSNAQHNVTIQVVPASVTGNKPVEGPVTSRAYLRVDFP